MEGFRVADLGLLGQSHVWETGLHDELSKDMLEMVTAAGKAQYKGGLGPHP